MTPTPHDALFKAVFSDPEHAAGALRAALPRALAARFDWSTLALVPGSFIDESLAGSYTDLLFSARLSGRPALLYLLYEHRSTPHPRMPFRALKYSVRIWDDWERKHPAGKLPAIVSVVFHHGEGGWAAPVAFDEQLDLDERDLRAVGPHIPRFKLIVDDIGGQGDEALRLRAMSALGRLALLCFKYARDPDELMRRLGRWTDLVREVWRAPNGRAALAFVVRYIFEIGGERPVKKLRELAAKQIGKDAEEAVMSYAEQLRAEGRKEGIREGRRKAQRDVLLRLLRARFGDLPEPAAARIKAAKATELAGWLDRVLDATTLDDVLSG
jgi:predicted transposase/invertase (TIGR01784 family)